jgi:hypothetical protein
MSYEYNPKGDTFLRMLKEKNALEAQVWKLTAELEDTKAQLTPPTPPPKPTMPEQSRLTQEMINDGWRVFPGTSVMTRN